MEQQPKDQQREHVFIRFMFFLRNRDARIVELFFLALNAYILALIVFPPYSYTGMALVWRSVVQVLVTGFNLAALIGQSKSTRIISSIANAAIMTLISVSLMRMENANAGTYGLLALLAAFVCWKINIR